MTKEEYKRIYFKYYHMKDDALREVLGDLYEKRYTDNNIDVFTEHRIACRVQLERTRDSESLVFHMKELQIRKSC